MTAAKEFISFPSNDSFTFHILFQVNSQQLPKSVPIDRWKITIERIVFPERNVEEVRKKAAIFLRAVLTLAHSSECYQFVNSLKNGYSVDYMITQEQLVDFAQSVPPVRTHVESALEPLKVSLEEVSLADFSESRLKTVKITDLSKTKEEMLVSPLIRIPTHLQAIKPTVTPFRDIGMRKLSHASEEEAKLLTNEIKVDPEYFNDKGEEGMLKLIEDEDKDYPLDEFYKKIKDIKKGIKLEEQQIPSLDDIESTFYELIKIEQEVKAELKTSEKN